ncbi:DUF3861 domain-containing protein [Vibrio tapetis subsp. quintayensis]|uniref:DUF3861 domain-containing protein n=1 Tax=Vibrio tapetis TaxID=52443 RepID=UPI0025B2FE48|nr:DUF3861 domain-containing protein [Vibrio tapetis]MDN3680952.1 DUF3861 domain-containing protein [Vibrio tapetis subsp. quintayensis]
MLDHLNKENTYRVTIEKIELGSEKNHSLQFDFEDREDLFKTISRLKEGSGLEAKEATKTAVALRLLGPLMIKNRKHPLFIDFMPHFKTFMKHLKSTVKNSQKGD